MLTGEFAYLLEVLFNSPAQELYQNFPEVLQSSQSMEELAVWMNEIPYLCPDGKMYAFEELPPLSSESVHCYPNLLYRDLVERAWELYDALPGQGPLEA
jgi:hypothetical protein